MRRWVGVLVVLSLLGGSALWGAENDPPPATVRLVFIHHSTGQNWLEDGNGALGIALRDHNYYVSDTNYGWTVQGTSNSIGDMTDIGHWWLWFRGPESSAILSALYAEGEQRAGYQRPETGPEGENEIVMFKSCFPNSNLQGNAGDPVPAITDNELKGQDCSSDAHTVANAKGIYIDILEYFRTRPDKLFVVITQPPLSDVTWASNARAFTLWLTRDWLKNYTGANVFVFDFFNVLTTNGGSSTVNDLGASGGNHHRWWNGAVQHLVQVGSGNTLAYPSGDDHPSQAGNLKATGEFVDLLNVAVYRWRDRMAADDSDVNGDGHKDILDLVAAQAAVAGVCQEGSAPCLRTRAADFNGTRHLEAYDAARLASILAGSK